MISTTLREYKENYKANLDFFLNDYEDNTETIFLQNELVKYTNLLDVLIKQKDKNESFTFQAFFFETLEEHFNGLKLKDIGIDLKKPENYITSIKRIIEFITEKNNSETDMKVDESKDETLAWFKIGLFFANGKAQQLYKKYKSEKGHFKKIALELGFKDTDRPYFSETINNSTKNTKNIYKNFKKMNTIYNYCKKNNLSIDDDFMCVFNALEK